MIKSRSISLQEKLKFRFLVEILMIGSVKIFARYEILPTDNIFERKATKILCMQFLSTALNKNKNERPESLADCRLI